MKISKKMKSVLSEIGYTAVIMDREVCGYKKLVDHDIEISNMNNNKKMNYYVYVWSINNELRIVNQYKGISSIERLKEILEVITSEYK